METSRKSAFFSTRPTAPLALFFLLSGFFPAAAQSDETSQEAEAPAKKPSLWQRLKTEGVRVEVGRGGVRTGPAQAPGGSKTASPPPMDNRSGYGGDSDEPLYTSLGGAGRLGGLFAGDDAERRQKGLLEWPRAAVTFTEYGPHLACWKGTARIWSSAQESKEETFRLCNAPGILKDAFGRPGVINWQVISSYATQMRVAQLMNDHTGSRRTPGPKPPQQPFGLPVSTAMQPGGLIPADDPLDVRLDAMLVRLAWATGYLPIAEMEGIASAGYAEFRDKRLWVVGFEPGGMREAQP